MMVLQAAHHVRLDYMYPDTEEYHVLTVQREKYLQIRGVHVQIVQVANSMITVVVNTAILVIILYHFLDLQAVTNVLV